MYKLSSASATVPLNKLLENIGIKLKNPIISENFGTPLISRNYLYTISLVIG